MNNFNKIKPKLVFDKFISAITYCNYGDRGSVVYEPLTMVRDYRISWEENSKISAELARLRWEKRWAVKKIADHMGLSYDSAKKRLQRLNKARAAVRRNKKI
ncbi:MAG: hypothetical protein A4S09_07890 [Proteobacteria bacterium SG_bin7]|nr:MAG: hypothetical protein A4S09_07890 [Proteobacteria bacterium SG_bin7]